MRKLTTIGIFTIILGLLFGFVHAIILVLNFLYLTEIKNYIPFTRLISIFIIFLGMFLIGIGGLSSKNNKEIKENTKGHKKIFSFLFFLIITPILAFSGLFPSIFIPTIILISADILSISFIVWLLIVLPQVADKIGEEIVEIHFLNYHIHESVLGIAFVIPGFLFIIHGVTIYDTLYGCYTMLVGAFLIGRDIEDVKKFKFIEKIKILAKTNLSK